jgi:hypothetical protein
VEINTKIDRIRRSLGFSVGVLLVSAEELLAVGLSDSSSTISRRRFHPKAVAA